jgi:hypothetical protein
VINVPFTKSALKDIKKFADSQKKTVPQVIQESVAVNRWIAETKGQGGKVVAERAGKKYELGPRNDS